MTFTWSSSVSSAHHNQPMMIMTSSVNDWHQNSASSAGPYPTSWSKNLDYVLSDRPALDAFREWIVHNSLPHSLELYFALRAYERMAHEQHQQTIELAKSIHSKYISLRTGCCDFIPRRLRQDVGLRVKMLTSTGNLPDPNLFSMIEPTVKQFLSRQHEQFVSSDEFIDVLNKFSFGISTPPLSERRRSKRISNPMMTSTSASANPQLTAEMLLRSRYDRQTRLGESVVERMYSMPSSSGYVPQPYVCRATTSQNDSAVSSSFSSEAHPTSRLRSIREEHRRANAATFALPRVEQFSKSDGQQFDHSTEDGRRVFANVLLKKLNRELQRRLRNDETERQLRDIEDRRYTAREVISTAAAEPVDPIDDDDDLDRYVERMREDSLKASAQRSPRLQLLSPRQFSPDRCRTNISTNVAPAPAPTSAVDDVHLPSTTNGFMPLMTSSNYPMTSSALPVASLNISHHQHAPSFITTATSSGNSFNCYKNGYSSRSAVYDSSGIESMAPSDHSKHSGSNTRRVYSSSGASSHTPVSRRARARSGAHHPSSNSAIVHPLITISYKGSDGVPVVAHVPFVNGMMTLREFRKHLFVSSQANVQFFFKAPMDDEDDPESSAPYQLLLVNDDSIVLPVYRGRITAELKSSSPQ